MPRKAKQAGFVPSPYTRKTAIAFTEEVAEEVCAWVASGKSVTSYCAQKGKIAKSAIFKNLVTHDWFMEMYERACRARAFAQVEEMVDIADTEPDPQRARVRIWARQWHASKMNDKFKDKQTVEHEGGLTVEIVRFSDAPVADDDAD